MQHFEKFTDFGTRFFGSSKPLVCLFLVLEGLEALRCEVIEGQVLHRVDAVC